jgi:hypothetical protein
LRFRNVILVTCIAFCATGLAHAGWFELGLNNDAVMVSGGTHHGNDPQGRFALGGRGLYSNEHGTKLGAFSARFDAEASGVSGLSFGVGTDVMLGKSDDGDIGAVAIGVEGAFAPAAWRGAFFGARVAYAPGIFSWSDTDSLLEWSVRGGYRVSSKIDIFAEYRRLEADFSDLGRRDLDDSVKVGFGGRF